MSHLDKENTNTLSQTFEYDAFSKEVMKNASDENKESYSKRLKDAQELINKMYQCFYKREQPNIIKNGQILQSSYVYNYQKATNYTPDLGSDDDNNLTTGHIYEVIFTLSAICLGLQFNPLIKVKDVKGNESRELSNTYKKLAKYSFELENFKTSILPFILNETFTQGDCFILEHWEVIDSIEKVPYIEIGSKKKYITDKNRKEYYEKLLTDNSFVEKIKFEDKKTTTRRARSIKLDGRCLLEGNPEIEEIQNQPYIFIEYLMHREQAEGLFHKLKYWDLAKASAGNSAMQYLFGKPTIYNESRIRESKDLFYIHYYFNKDENKYNLFINGIMMYEKDTPMNIFFPAMNYPITHFKMESVSGSLRGKGVPDKLKYVSDYLDFFINIVAYQREAATIPAINVTGRRTIKRDMFKAGSVNHNIEFGKDYHYADSDVHKRGIQQGEMEWVNKIQEIMQNQSLNSITLGQSTEGQLATGIVASQQNQLVRLKPIVHNFLKGMCDLYERRLETIKYKYSIPTKEEEFETDKEDEKGKKKKKMRNVYQEIEFTESDYTTNIKISDLDTYGDTTELNRELFKKSFDNKQLGRNIDFEVLDAKNMQFCNIIVDGEFKENLTREQELNNFFTQMQIITSLFPNADRAELEKTFLSLTDYPDSFFKQQYETPINNTNISVKDSGSSQQGNTPSGLAYDVSKQRPL